VTDERRRPVPAGSVPVAEKGPPATPPSSAPAREWTSRDLGEERRMLETQLADARARGDDEEVRRLEARLRLLAGP
jgi:hypothetical protein